MKKLNQILFASILMLGLSVISMSFTSIDLNDKICIDVSDNSCVLYVKTSYGSAAKSVKVSTDVSGGISCSGGRSFYTDSDGRVELKWSSGCYLRNLFVDGKAYDVDYKDGETYYLNMK